MKRHDEQSAAARRMVANAQLVITILAMGRGLVGIAPTSAAVKEKLWEEQYQFQTTFWPNLVAFNLVAPPTPVAAAQALGVALEVASRADLSNEQFLEARTSVNQAIETFTTAWRASKESAHATA